MENIKKIKDLIAEDQLEESLNELDALTVEKNYELQNGIISLRRRLKDLKRGELSGALSYQDISQEKAKINDALLDLLNELEGAPTAKQAPVAARAAAAPAPKPAAKPATSGSKKMVWMVVGAIALVIVLVVIFSPSGSTPDETGGEFIEQGTERQQGGEPFEQATDAPTEGEFIEQGTDASQEEILQDTVAPDTLFEQQQVQ
ncbi:MAG: hypothetical protein AAB316_16690 [Bacteroidota bacterium]